MFRHTDYMQFDVKPEKPDPVYARKLQELLGGAFGRGRRRPTPRRTRSATPSSRP